MLGSFFGRVYTGILGLSLLLLSNYTGNDARFTNFQYIISEQSLVINCFLSNAFDNDFEEIFKSGIEIPIYFDSSVLSNKEIVAQKSFKHTVRWDSNVERWRIFLEDQDYTFYTDNYTTLINALSTIEIIYQFDTTGYRRLDYHITAKLPKLYIPSIDKEVDLMVLWKLRIPELKTRLDRTGV